MKTIKVLEKEISLYSQKEADYICITDIAKYKNSETTGLIISHWLGTRFTVEFMGFWGKIHNPDFNVTEFRNIKNQSNSNGFVLTVKQWVQKTNVIPKKSIFNKIIGDSSLELQFAAFLEECDDIISYVKNYMAVHFKIDYVNAKGEISNYYPDFIVKKSAKEIFIIETKGLEDLDVPLKMERLRQWCEDINSAQSDVKYDYVFVDEESFNQYQPKSFKELIAGFRFREYKE
ncbi:MAG: KilA-N domain-containing protein [Thermodesulfobacteriota bacterium]|nr:KilA-N domain-containing protein [Thermodesulfobacteriota bacterium]